MSRLIEFYRGAAPDSEGRTLAQIWDFSDEEMEDYHDFIQWLFPLREPSQYNPHAPLLTEEDVTTFRTDATLRDHLLRSLDRFLEFVGLERREDRIDPSPGSEQKRGRLDESQSQLAADYPRPALLRMLGLEEQGRQLFSSLEDLNQRGEARLSPSTLAYWKTQRFPGELVSEAGFTARPPSR